MAAHIGSDIRKLRKKLRQIEHLESLERELTDEEYVKISNKTSLRATLLGLLAETSSFSQDNASSWVDTSHELSSSSIADTSHELSTNAQESSCLNENLENEPIERDGAYVDDESAKDAVNSISNEGMSDVGAGSKRTYDTDKTLTQTSADKPSSDNADSTPVKKPCTQPRRPIHEMSEFSNENAEERKRANKMMQQMQRKWRKQAFQVHYLEGHNDLITAVDVCQDMLLSGSRDTMVKLWHLNTGTEERSFGGHTGTVTCVAMIDSSHSQSLALRLGLEGDDGARLGLSGSTDCSVRLWNLNTGELIRSIYTYNPVSCVLYVPSLYCVISASDGGKVELWSLEDGVSMQSIRAHDDKVTSLKMHGNFIFTSSADGLINVYEIRDHSLCTVFVSENIKMSNGMQPACRPVLCLQPTNDAIFYGDDGLNIKVLDWKTGIVDKISNHLCDFGSTGSLSVMEDLLFSSGYDLDTGIGFINVRSLPGKEYLCTIKDEEIARIRCLCVAKSKQDELHVIIGGSDLVLYKTTKRTEGEDVMHASYIDGYNSRAEHSDMDSESEWSDTEPEDGAASNKYSSRKRPSQSSTTDKGWLSYCAIL